MKKYLCVTLIIATTVLLNAQEQSYDDNTAFYEGLSTNYVISPPQDYQMNNLEATDDGYSFAFIPKDTSYAEASVIIGVSIFKLKDSLKETFNLDELIGEDTSALRDHYGPAMTVKEVAPTVTILHDSLRTIYINNTDEFIPTVMYVYLYGIDEVFIFDLNITTGVARFKAEELFIEFIKNIKILPKGSIEAG